MPANAPRSSVNEPEIWTVPGKLGVCTVGADWITSSSTIASWCDGHVDRPLKHCWASAFQTSCPSPRRSTVTIHCCFWLSPALALPRWNTSPVPPAGPTRQICWPSAVGQHVLPGGIGRRGLDRHRRRRQRRPDDRAGCHGHVAGVVGRRRRAAGRGGEDRREPPGEHRSRAGVAGGALVAGARSRRRQRSAWRSQAGHCVPVGTLLSGHARARVAERRRPGTAAPVAARRCPTP